MMSQNHPWVKNALTVQDKLLDFNVEEYEKITNMVSNTTLQPTFKKLPLIKFWCNIKELSA